MVKKILGWKFSIRAIIKIGLMVLCCLVLCLIPVMKENSVIRAFVVSGNASKTTETIGSNFFNEMASWFIIVTVLIFVVNLIFFIIDSIKNDTVEWRRRLQIALNIIIILVGLAVAAYMIGFYKSLKGWSEIAFSKSFIRKIKWVPYVVFAATGVFQMFWDIWLFSAENRNPLIHKILLNEARREDEQK